MIAEASQEAEAIEITILLNSQTGQKCAFRLFFLIHRKSPGFAPAYVAMRYSI